MAKAAPKKAAAEKAAAEKAAEEQPEGPEITGGEDGAPTFMDGVEIGEPHTCKVHTQWHTSPFRELGTCCSQVLREVRPFR